MVETFRSWTEANKAVPTMSEEQAEGHLRAELARDQPRKNFVARFYGRFANMRRKREQAEIGIPYFYREGWPGYNEDMYRVVWKSRATNASGRSKPLTRVNADYEMAWMKKARPDYDHWLEIVEND